VTINIRQKGADGERQVIKMLTPIIVAVMTDMGAPKEDIENATKMVQRNQNQSAVGGNDLSNTFGISIEVKRQEQLAINTWWQQCETAAIRNNELPVLIFKQNNKPWRFITYGFLHAPAKEGGWTSVKARVEFNQETFERWFAEWVRGKLLQGYEVRV
jgi:hypothetical protein